MKRTPRDERWYADDFETTTDLDGPRETYHLTDADLERLQNLMPGESRTTAHGTYTMTVTCHDDGTLTAYTRTGHVRVWAWAIREVETGEVWTGTDIASYVETAATLGGIHWFHNLRFDAAFLDTYLCAPEPEGLGMCVGQWSRNHVPGGCIIALISSTGEHYSRYVHMRDARRFEVRDSLKKFPRTSVADLADMYGHPTAKGSIDYHLERPVGYEPTDEEWEYLRTDVSILAHALAVPLSVGATALTVGADAMYEYRWTIEHSKFRTIFPLLDRGLDDCIRKAYRGGWTYLNPEHRGKVIEEEGSVWDVNSMYPSVMRYESFPYGAPVSLAPGQTELDGYPHVIYGAVMNVTLKPGRLPMLQVKDDSRYVSTEYLSEATAVEWWGTEIDWALLREQYEVEICVWIAGFAFKGRRDLFTEYIEKWSAVKGSSTGGMRQQAKFQLNNLWGRFGVNPLRGGRSPEVTDDIVSYRATPTEYGEPCYTPVAIYTTSYARDRIVRAAQGFGDKFLAADTDSCHIIGTDPGELDVDETRLGAWKREAVFDKATYLRPKAYAERIKHIDGTTSVEAHVAGVPRRALYGVEVEDIKIGARFSGKLTPHRVPGGVILAHSDFEIVDAAVHV